MRDYSRVMVSKGSFKVNFIVKEGNCIHRRAICDDGSIKWLIGNTRLILYGFDEIYEKFYQDWLRGKDFDIFA